MRKLLLIPLALIAFSAATPTLAADIDLSIRMPGVQIYLGDRDRDGRYWDGGRWRDERWWRDNGRYWDGGRWRDERWWRDNCHRYEGRKDFRGRCEPRRGDDGRDRDRHDDDHFCPPGQAKKGRC